MATTKTNQNQMDTRTMQVDRETEIAAVINARYDINDQIALIRQKDNKPEEYEAFYQFCEQVKATVTASRAAQAKAAAADE